MNNVNHALALRITELLKKKNITRYRLALNSGITHSTLKNIIHETVKDNLLSTTILIASGFDKFQCFVIQKHILALNKITRLYLLS